METIKGTVKFIGNSRTNKGGEMISVLEIGNRTLRNIFISDYLENYLKLGSEVEILTYKGTFTSRYIAGIRVDNKVYKLPASGTMTGFILKTIFIAPFLFLIPFMFIQPTGDSDTFFAGGIGIALISIFLAFKIKHTRDLAKF